MRNQIIRNIILIIVLIPLIAYSQTKHRFFVNKINLPIDNKGIIGSVNIQDPDPFINGAGGKFDESVFLFSSGFFLSGYANGIPFSNTISEASIDYHPGIVGSTPEDSLNIIYVVKNTDSPFSSSWQKWKDAVSLGADFYDGDGNGIYNPKDKNFNGTWDLNEDMPPLIGDEIAWCIYNDGVPASLRRYGVEPLGIEIQQTLFASSNPELENVVFIKYKITNTGLVDDVLDTVFFSPWDDTDIGQADDDFGGCDTILNSVFTYNLKDDSQYGINPPAVFTTFVQGPLSNTANMNDTAFIKNGVILGEQNITGYKNLGLYSFTGYAKNAPTQHVPTSIEYVWNYINALDGEGNELEPCDTLYGQVHGNVDCSKVNQLFWFSGDPVDTSGWLDRIAMDDRKFSSIGPFILEKSKPVEIILALVVGRGMDELNSITAARETVQKVFNEYKTNFAALTFSAPKPTKPVTDYILHQNYPNPFNPTTTIRYDIPQDGFVNLEIFDVIGQKVKTLLNQFMQEDRYEIEFSGNGLSSGIYLYKLKVNDFTQTKKMILLR